MKRSFAILFVVLFLFAGSCRQQAQGETRKVTVKSGLTLRDGAGLEKTAIALIPFNETVTVESDTGPRETIGGVDGQWILVRWSGHRGWAFGGFLERVNSADGQSVVADQDWPALQDCIKSKPSQCFLDFLADRIEFNDVDIAGNDPLDISREQFQQAFASNARPFTSNICPSGSWCNAELPYNVLAGFFDSAYLQTKFNSPDAKSLRELLSDPQAKIDRRVIFSDTEKVRKWFIIVQTDLVKLDIQRSDRNDKGRAAFNKFKFTQDACRITGPGKKACKQISF